MARYRIEKRRGFSRLGLLVLRARLTDERTRAVIDFRKRELAEEAARLLEREDAGDPVSAPPDASPFPAFEISDAHHDGSVFMRHGVGALVDTATVAVSRDKEFARRVARVLSRANARPVRPWRGPVKSRYF